jgi:hypothetical protein
MAAPSTLNEGEAIGPAVGELKSEGCENILIVYESHTP